ncbi:MAG: hypothetical protein LBB87_02545 [Nitrososphaerota archaeon]|jgi:hypothetical protein|nr:hypothetical protein [Nitrososphaerota archaeon]
MNGSNKTLVTKTSKNMSYKRIASLFLVVIMLAGILPGGLINITNNVNAAPDSTWTPDEDLGEVLVTTQQELYDALRGVGTNGADPVTINGNYFSGGASEIKKIYLGADLTYAGAAGTAANALRGRQSLIIEGVNPQTEIRHTLTFTNPLYENPATGGTGRGGIIPNLTS